MNKWIILAGAIVFEVIGTSALKASDSFTKLGPSIIVAVAYAGAFYLLSMTLKTMSVGVAYAIWSGAGVLLIALASWIFYGQSLDVPAMVGMVLIVAGVAVINLFSKTGGH